DLPTVRFLLRKWLTIDWQPKWPRSWGTRFRSFRGRKPFMQFKSFKTFKPTDGKIMNDISCHVLVVGAGLAGFTAAVRRSMAEKFCSSTRAAASWAMGMF